MRMSTSLYTELILDEARHPRNYGLLSQASRNSSELNPSCGDSIKLTLALDDAGVITAVGWEGDGCIISRAAMSVLSAMMVGKTLAAAKEIELRSILTELKLESLSPGRETCARIGLEAVRSMSQNRPTQ